jgi:hypothetical protein
VSPRARASGSSPQQPPRGQHGRGGAPPETATARNEKMVREVTRSKRELAAARPRLGCGKTRWICVRPETGERRDFASWEPGRQREQRYQTP